MAVCRSPKPLMGVRISLPLLKDLSNEVFFVIFKSVLIEFLIVNNSYNFISVSYLYEWYFCYERTILHYFALFCNNAIASATLETPISLTLSPFLSILSADMGTMQVLNPILAASLILLSV